MRPTSESLPRHDELGLRTRIIEVACFAGASGLLVVHLFRLFMTPGLFTWWLPVAVLAAMLLADLASGIIHWVADTWGSETMPVLGRRFLRPFRVHHVNPDDFLRRDFIDTNGDVALITIPFLLTAWLIPLDHELGRLAVVSLVAFSAGALPTNQVHQWAHMGRPPAWVRTLQRWGLLLSREQHQVHHTAPHAVNYCITTGWCNRALTAVGFFPALEWVVTRLTGLEPRSEDQAFAAGVAGSPAGRSALGGESGS
jgi:ubiquitin-conjugating enzyme E2 variant